MKQLHKFICLFLTLIFLIFSFTGCQKEEKKAECPFTTIEWGATLEDIKNLEGECTETWDSSYKGTTYAYPKEYDGLDGIINYIFDDKEELVGLGWTYISDDANDVKSVYEKLHSEAEEALGKSGYHFDARREELNSKLQDNQEALKAAGMSTPLSDVWYLDSGNVLVYAVITDSVKAVQYTYLHPDVSQKDPEK